MVCPERSVLLAGAKPVRVSAGAPGSRPQPKAEMPPATAGRQKPLKEKGARKRAATLSERCSHVIVSAETTGSSARSSACPRRAITDQPPSPSWQEIGVTDRESESRIARIDRSDLQKRSNRLILTTRPPSLNAGVIAPRLARSSL